MDFFSYHDGQLSCEQLPLAQIAELVGTPTYVYSRGAISERCRAILQAFSSYPTTACFAVKSNSNLTLLRDIFSHGFGADLVSLGELERALLAGAQPSKIVFSGVGKRNDEIARALEVGIATFNVESAYELEQIASVAAARGDIAPICLRINPNIDAKTNPKIATGLYSTKFGLPENEIDDLVARIKELPSLRLIGLACHIGSQIVDLAPLRDAALRLTELSQRLMSAGFKLELIDLGGGLGIRYGEENPPTLADYAGEILRAVRPTGLPLVIEPGRAVIGNAGVLLTKVLGVKKTPHKSFVVIDAAMNDLLRPTLYNAYHAVEPVGLKNTQGSMELCDFVGPICETGDYLAKDRQTVPPKVGDLYVIRSCGAYGASMASHYNSRTIASEILVDEDRYFVIRQRESLNRLWEMELQGLAITPLSSGK